jgi:carbonic anhydrase/acetyltransferase-like protein (isoleucine patch superfamily)
MDRIMTSTRRRPKGSEPVVPRTPASLAAKNPDRAMRGRLRDAGGYYVADTAVLVGDVALGTGASVWFHAVVRGDDAPIKVGDRTNLQDFVMVHPEPGEPMKIGSYVTVGHRAILHGRSIGDRSLIGMGAILLGGSVVGSECVVAAGSVVREGGEVPSRTLVAGVPAKVIRKLTDAEVAEIVRNAEGYFAKAKRYLP